MDWVGASVLATIVAALLLASLPSRRLEVGMSGDWILGWAALLFSGMSNLFPIPGELAPVLATSTAPLFPVLMLSGAFRYSNRKVPRALPPLALTLCCVCGISTFAGHPDYTNLISLVFFPALCAMAAIIVIPTAKKHGTILQRLTAPGLFVVAGVQAVDAYNGIASIPSWNPLLVWLATGLPVGTLQSAGSFELVGDRLTHTSQERERTAAALAISLDELRTAHSEMEERVVERTKRLRDEVAERRQVEDALRESHVHYHKVISLLSDFNLAAKVDRKGNLHIEWVTGSDRHGTQHTRRSIGMEEWKSLIHPEDFHALRACFAGALREEVTGFETRITTKDEEVRWMRGRMMGERNAATDDVMIYASGRDVTREKHAEAENATLHERIREGQRLESLGALSRGVAHDFNNLLSVIIGNASMIGEGLPEGSPLVARTERIRKSARYAADIAMQMLTYSGSASVSPEPLNLSNVVAEMSELIEAGTNHRIQLSLNVDSDLPLVMGDSSQVRQIVLNLITNASEAMGDEGGRVALSTGRLHVGPDSVAGLRHVTELIAGDYVYLEVADNGPGLDADTQAQVFDPFFSTKLSGRGLGLAVVRGIARAHSAAISLTSSPGNGTRFRVLFPEVGATILETIESNRKSNEQQYVADSVAIPTTMNVARTVLVIDDDEYVGEIAQAALQRSGYNVLVADGGNQGVELFAQNRDKIDVIVLDLSMPDMSGEEVLEHIRKIAPDVPALISSGYASSMAAKRIRVTHRVEFLGKPYEPEVLVESVEAMLPRSS
jgi:signal transduction histidine kinase/CheY-like chemotaxis protein